MRFLIGLVCGLLVLGGYVGYQEVQRREDPCRGHCGTELECVEGVCLVPEPKAKTKRKRRRRRRRRRGRRRGRRTRPGAEVAAASDEPELRQPTAADLKRQTKGPSLRKAEYVDLASSGTGGGRELSNAEINTAVRKRSMRIVACIDKARGDLDINRGKVTVGFRIERSGRVKKVRVSAPSALMRRGLYGCVKPLITGLRFGPTSRSLIMSYPYALN